MNLASNRGGVYTYDRIGNRLDYTKNSITTNYVANSLNQYTDITGRTNPVYDNDGNMLGLGNGWTCGWDAENRLTEATNGTTRIVNTYDYMSRRVRKEVFTGSTKDVDLAYIYDGWNVVRELNMLPETPVVLREYVWGLDLSLSLQGAGGVGGLLAVRVNAEGESAVSYATYDANGNVSEYIDAVSGNVAGHYEYDAFGNLTKETGDNDGDFPHRFSTKYLDGQTTLYYYGHRFYSPELGRWLSRDPIGEMGGFALYIFVDNDSLSDLDSMGLIGLKELLQKAQKQLREGTYELDIPLGMTGWDLVGTLKLEKTRRPECLKTTLSLGVSIGVKQKLMGIVSKTPVVGSTLKKAIGKLPDASAQIYASGTGTICCDCWDFESISMNVQLTLGNGSHGGNSKSGLDFGVWGTGTGKWDTNAGTVSVGGSLSWAVNINVRWVAYNADGTIWSGNLIGATGDPNTLLEIGGPYESLKVGSDSPCGK